MGESKAKVKPNIGSVAGSSTERNPNPMKRTVNGTKVQVESRGGRTRAGDHSMVGAGTALHKPGALTKTQRIRPSRK